MRVSWSWLQDFIDLSDLTPAYVARRLTDAGIEVEGIEDLGAPYRGIVVGYIRERIQHPNADRLGVCTVDDGSGNDLQIVCGAPNAAAGLKVPLATLGTTMPGGLQIVQAAIRGVESFGMLCSAKELGLSSDHGGLMVLAEDSLPGQPLADALGLNDTVLEVSLTPNRADCLSIYGIARELSAVLGRPLKRSPSQTIGRAAAASDGITVQVDATDRCSLYAAAAVSNVTVGPTPAWIVRRLDSVGQRTVNNIVDITNYVLFEYGQPLHAFDRSKLVGNVISVANAENGESFDALDRSSRLLDSDDLTIRDAKGAIALAGVIGGLDSSVTESTTSIIFEAARFQPSAVRRTARRHGLRTESSYRFERSVDVDTTLAAMARAIELLEAFGAGTSCQVSSDWAVAHGVRPAPASVKMPLSMPEKILGVAVSAEECVRLLTSLGLTVTCSGESLQAVVPCYRPDLVRPIDLVEEIGRLRGYGDFPSGLPSGELGMRHQTRSDAPVEQPHLPIEDASWRRAFRRVVETSVQAGLYEAVNWSLVSDADLSHFGTPAAVRLLNPLSAELAVMRTTLLPGLLRNVRSNQALGNAAAALFETGAVFRTAENPGGEPEPLAWAAVQWGVADGSWHGAGRGFDGWDLAGTVRSIGRVLDRPVEFVSASPAPWCHPGEYADVHSGGVKIGWVAQLHPDVVEAFDVSGEAFAAEIDLSLWLSLPAAGVSYRTPIRRTPSIRDAALLVPQSVTWSVLTEVIGQARPGILESWFPFDVYQGDKIAAGMRSIGVRFTYRAAGDTLTDEQIQSAHLQVLEALEKRIGASQRS
jgi:phenylalanyl-tRNA synthetase beta chain